MFTTIKHLLGGKPSLLIWLVLGISLAFVQNKIPDNTITIMSDAEARGGGGGGRGGARGGGRGGGGAHAGGRRHHTPARHTARRSTARRASTRHYYREDRYRRHRRVLVVGALVATLPTYCTVTYVGGISYHTCDGVYYRPRYEGATVVYVVVDQP